MPTPRDSIDPVADLLIQRAVTSGAAWFDLLRERLVGHLAAMRQAGESTEALLGEARRILFDAMEPLIALLADAELAAWLNGAEGVARHVPVGLLPERRSPPAGALNIQSVAAPPSLPPSAIPPFESLYAGPAYEWEGFGAWHPLVDEAIASLRAKNLVTAAEYRLLSDQARQRAFGVSYARTTEAAEKVRAAVIETVQEGTGLSRFRERVNDAVGTGGVSPAILENSFRTAVGQSYMEGLERMASGPVLSAVFPYRGRLDISDVRQTELCRLLARAGLNKTSIMRADDPSWQRYRPLSHHGCRCGISVLTVEKAAAKGVKEAQRWLKTGQPPATPEWVAPPAVEHLVPKGWVPR